MSNDKPTPSVASEWLDKISDLMSNTDKGLDQVRKSIQSDLGKLRQSPSLESLAANLLQLAEIGFRKDLDEIGLRGEAQTEYIALFRKTWQEKEMSKKADEIIKSPELAAMNEFITTIENLPKLHEVMVMAQPQPKWQAMLKGFASQFPGLDKYVDQYFGPVLNMLGLGFLAGPETPASGTQTASATQTPGTEKPAEDTTKAPAETKEFAEKMIPKGTCFLGDSITAGILKNCAEQKVNPLNIDGKKMTIAKGGQDTEWCIEQLNARKETMEKTGKNPLKDIENAVVLFGTNDIGLYEEHKPVEKRNWSAEKIFERLEKIYRMLKEDFHVKHIYAVTVPPYGGYEPYEKRGDVGPKREELNKRIKGEPPYQKSKYISHVIDICKTENEGGLASNEDPRRFCGRANADYLHPKRHILAEVYQRELEKGTALNARQEGKAQPKPEKAKPAPAESAFQTPLDGAEVVPEDFKPGETLLTGDSIYNAYPAGLKEKLNVTGTVTKGAMQSSWGLRQLKAKPDAYFKKFEYAVIGFGTNDLSGTYPPEKIWERLKSIITLLKEKNPNIKILMPTIPPAKGCTCGEWARFKGTEARRIKVNELIRQAKANGLVAEIIDLAATKNQGGLANDKDPESMVREYQRWGDGIHPTSEIMATAIRRAQYLARN